MGNRASKKKDTYLKHKECPKCGDKMERRLGISPGMRYMAWCCTKSNKIGKTENYEDLCGYREKI